MSLRVVAISAPDYLNGRTQTQSLTSQDPVSLYNACRYAAFLAESGFNPWADSNWAVGRKQRRKKFLLMNSLEEESSYFEELLANERPNLLLIGAMTLCLPGAIECAKLAKEMFGNKICIVLGGRHVNETLYQSRNGIVEQHVSSPLRLMSEGIIEKNFDIVISGECEFIIAKIGELIDGVSEKAFSASELSKYLNEAIINKVPGKWLLGFLDGERMHTIVSSGPEIDRDQLPTSHKLFGIRSKFNIFQGRLTGHAFSDIGSGCVYDCNFCSERNSVCGPLRQIGTAAERLIKQLTDINTVISEDNPDFQASAFIEDSVMLGGLNSQLGNLAYLLRNRRLDVKFGGQLTIDLVARHNNLLKELRQVGLEYLFVGLETIDPASIGGMNKDIGSESWLVRAERQIEFLSSSKIALGFSVLFGLGESQEARLSLIEQLARWQANFGQPVVVSYNWAVQHPLCSQDMGSDYLYTNWGADLSEYIDYFRDYGEASTRYPIHGVPVPTIRELAELSVARSSICSLIV